MKSLKSSGILRHLSLFLVLAFLVSGVFNYAYSFDKDAVEKMREKLSTAKETPSVQPAQPAVQAPETAKPEKNRAEIINDMKAALAPQAPVTSEVAAPSSPALVQAKDATVETGLTLVESIKKAIDNNRNLKSAEKNINLADIKIKEAEARYEPELSINGVLTRLDRANTVSLGPAGSIKMSDNVLQDYKISATKALYTFNRVEYGKAMAEKYKNATIFSVDSARINLIFNVKKSFYDLMLAREFVKVAQESLDLIRAHVQTVKNRFNAGTASKFDLLRVEVQEANTKPNLIKAVNGLAISKNVFNNILAMPIFYEVEIAGRLSKPELPVVELEDAVKVALETRQDVKASQSGLQAAETALKLAKVNDKPTVALAGTYEQAKGKSVPVDKFDETWNMSVVAQMPIYDAKQTKHMIMTATENLSQKTIDHEQLIENVKLDVKVAHQELIQSNELIMASEKNVEQAREALSIAQVSYDNGLNTNLEIMDAQLALTQAKTNYFQALHDYMVAFAKLERSMGIGRIAE